jgi:hypothetical protein
MMNFITFNGTLLLYGFVAMFVMAFCVTAILSPLFLLAKNGPPPKVIAYPLAGLSGIFQVYFWGFWSVVCVAVTIKYTQRPDVTWDWLYWITAFSWTTTLIGWLVQKEMANSESFEESSAIRKGTVRYSLVAIIAFLVFAFSPQYGLSPYKPLLQPLGLDTYLVSKIDNRMEADTKTRDTIEGFFGGYDDFTKATILFAGMNTSQNPLGDLVKVESLMNQAREQLSKLDIRILNELYSGWGDAVSIKLIPALELISPAMRENEKVDLNDIAKADRLATEFHKWLRSNWNEILHTLNTKYVLDDAIKPT